MEIRVKDNSVEIDGYVNAVERPSKTLRDKIGSFVERISAGAFGRALKRNDDVHILLNHDWNRDLGSTKKGNLSLKEDNIGLKAHAVIDDPEVVKEAKENKLVGWSFGFTDRDVTRDFSQEVGTDYRIVKDLDLYEVSILNTEKVPAYNGTLIEARDDGTGKEVNYRDTEVEPEINEDSDEKLATKIADKVVEKLATREEKPKEVEPPKEAPKVEEKPKQQEIVEKIDYSKYENLIKEMKEE